MNISQQRLDFLKKLNLTEYLQNFIAVDRPWIRYYSPKLTVQTAGGSVSKGGEKPWSLCIGGMLRARISFPFLQKGKTIIGEYCAAFRQVVNRKRQQLSEENVIFHKDNVPTPASSTVAVEIHGLPIQSQYSSYLTKFCY